MSRCHAFPKDGEEKVLGGAATLFVSSPGQAMGARWGSISIQNTCLNNKSNLALGVYSAMLPNTITNHGGFFYNIQIVLILHNFVAYL